MNLPNKITISRIFLIPFFLLFIIPMPEWMLSLDFLSGITCFIERYGDIVGTIIFLVAALTDGVDGYIARKYNLVSKLGIFLDPIADKLLVSGALLALLQRNEVNAWVVIVIICREFIVTGFRLIASGEAIVISANILGKSKTVLQMIFIFCLLSKSFIPVLENSILLFTLSILVVISTIYSGWDYIYSNRQVLKG